MKELPQISVAFIDDNDRLRDGICNFLKSFNYRVTFEAENGQDALQKLKEADAVPHVCIVDVNMPVLNGFETTKALHAQYPEIKVLGFSVNDDEESIMGMLRAGASGYVLKGADPDELKNAIEVLYRNGKYFSVGICSIVRQYFEK